MPQVGHSHRRAAYNQARPAVTPAQLGMRTPLEKSQRRLHVVWSQDELHKRTRVERIAAHWWRRALGGAIAVGLTLVVVTGLGVAITEAALHPYRRPIGSDDAASARRVAEEAAASVADVPLIAHDGAILAAWSFTRAAPSRGTVVVLHGIGDGRASQLPLAALLLSDGYRVLVPDARAHGASGGAMATAGIAEGTDLGGWVEWASQQHPNECVFAIGTSYGGAAILQSLRQTSYCAAVIEAPFASAYSMAFYWLGGHAPLAARWVLMGPIVEAGFAYARWHYGLPLRSSDVLDAVSRSRVPLLVIDDALDDAVPRRDAERLRDANPGRVQVWTVDSAQHAQAFGTAPDEYRGRVLRFLREHQ